MKGLLETILVVEDDDSTRQMLEGVLSTSGFRVLTAANSTQARSHISRDAPDLVVLDSSLVSGVEVLAALRATPALRRTPVLAVTGAGAAAIALRPFGSVTVLRKPLDVRTVVPAVQDLLARKAF